MVKAFYRKAALLLGIVVASVQAHAQLKIYTEDSPPLNFVKDRRLDGVAVALIQEIQKRAGDNSEIQVVPWARGYEAVQQDANTALFSTTRTPERERKFKWVGPLAGDTWIFVLKKGSPATINSLEDAKKLRAVGVYVNDAKEEYLKKMGFTNLAAVSNDESNVQKLVGGRIDAWFTSEETMKAFDGKNGASLATAFSAQRTTQYVAFSLKTDDAIVLKWQQAFDSMVKDGTYAAIHRKYGTLPAVK